MREGYVTEMLQHIEKKYLDGVRDYRQVTSVSQQLSQPPAQKQFVSMNYVIVYN